MNNRSKSKNNVPTNINANISMQENVDKYLFKNLNSPNPVLSNDGTCLTIYRQEGDIKLERTEYETNFPYGTVCRYEGAGLRYDVKFTDPMSKDPKKGNERRASVELMLRARLSKQACKVLNSRIIESADKLAILMPVMYTNLSMIQTSELDIKTKKDILDQIRTQMNCIIHLNDGAQIESKNQTGFKFSYLKLKPSNVLLKVKNGRFIVTLGNIGSIVERDNINEPGTFKSSYPIANNDGEYSTFVNSNIVNSMRYIFGFFSYLFIMDLFNEDNVNKYTPTNQELITFDETLVESLGGEYSDLFFPEGTNNSMY